MLEAGALGLWGPQGVLGGKGEVEESRETVGKISFKTKNQF